MTNRQLRDIEAVHADLLIKHPEDIDGLLSMAFADHAQDGNTVVLLTHLRTVARAKDISTIIL